jgi:ankyrin repeat protein
MSVTRKLIQKQDAEVTIIFEASADGKSGSWLLSFASAEVRELVFAKLTEKALGLPEEAKLSDVLERSSESALVIKQVAIEKIADDSSSDEEDDSSNAEQIRWTPYLLNEHISAAFNSLMAPPLRKPGKHFWLGFANEVEAQIVSAQLDVDFINELPKVPDQKIEAKENQPEVEGLNQFENMPTEVLLEIFSFMTFKDAVIASRASKMFHNALSPQEANLLWRKKFEQHFFSTLKGMKKEEIAACDKLEGGKNWYIEFRQKFEAIYAKYNRLEKNLFSWIKESDAYSFKAWLESNLPVSNQQEANNRKERMIKKGFDVLLLTDKANNKKLYQIALETGNPVIISLVYELVLQYYGGDNVDGNRRDVIGRSILHWAILLEKHPEHIETLIGIGCSLKNADNAGLKPLHFAIDRDRLDIVKALVEAYPELLEQKTEDNLTLLMYAAKKGKTEIVAYLLSKGAKQLAALDGKTALYYAVSNQRVHAAALLMKESVKVELPEAIPAEVAPTVPELAKRAADAKPHDPDRPKAMPLEGELAALVARGQKTRLRKAVLAPHLAIMRVGPEEDQVIHVAARTGNLDLVKALVENNPHPDVDLLQQFNQLGQTPFLIAVREGYLDLVDYCIQKGLWLNALDADKKSGLQFAIERGYTQIALKLIKAGAAFRIQVGEDGKQLIHHAIKSGNVEVIMALVNHDSSLLNQKDAYGRTPLILAMQKNISNKKQIIQFLISKKTIEIDAKIHRVDKDTGKPNHRDHGKTALGHALIERDADLAADLIRAGASLDIAMEGMVSDGSLPVHPLAIALHNDHLDLITTIISVAPDLLKHTLHGVPILSLAKSNKTLEFLLGKMTQEDLDVSPEEGVNKGKTALYLAAEKGDVERVKRLIAVKASLATPAAKDVAYPIHAVFSLDDAKVAQEMAEAMLAEQPDLLNQPDGKGETPLHLAVGSEPLDENIELIDFLLAKEVNVNPITPAMYTPLGLALRKGNVTIAKKLLAAGASLKEACKDLRPHPLHVALKKCNSQMVELLIEQDADLIELPDEKGEKPLLIAAKTSVTILKYLLDKNANVNARGDEGRTALHIVTELGLIKPITWLVAAGAAITCKYGADDVQPIHLAAQQGNFELMTELLKNGDASLLNQADAAGRTPLVYAAKNGHLNIVRYLISQHVNVNVMLDVQGTSKSLLCCLIEDGKFDIVHALIEADADLNLGVTALPLIHYVMSVVQDLKTSVDSQAKAKAIFRALLDKNPALLLNQVDKKGQTPLMFAAQLSFGLGMALELLTRGAAVDAKRADGKTALWLAMEDEAAANVPSVYSRLLPLASMTTSIEGRKPIHYLIEPFLQVAANDNRITRDIQWARLSNSGHMARIRLMVEARPEVLSLRDAKGRTPLLMAVEAGALDLANYLLSRSANANDSSNFANHNRNKSALYIAAEQGNGAMCALLLSHGATIDPKKPIDHSKLPNFERGELDLLAYELRRAKQGQYKRYLSIFGYQISFFGKRIGLGRNRERKLEAVKALKDFTIFSQTSRLTPAERVMKLKKYKKEIKDGELNIIRKRLGISFRNL